MARVPSAPSRKDGDGKASRARVTGPMTAPRTAQPRPMVSTSWPPASSAAGIRPRAAMLPAGRASSDIERGEALRDGGRAVVPPLQRAAEGLRAER